MSGRVGPQGPRGAQRPRLSGEDRIAVGKDLAILYDRGRSIREIAADTGRSFGVVRALLLEAGVTLRPRGGAYRKVNP